MEQGSRIQSHYDVSELMQAIYAALEKSGKHLGALTIDDLAPVDAFHIRGREATAELARLGAPKAGERVLDIGSGLGGTARYLASLHGCDVTGIDLTPSFCAAATELSALVGLSGQTRFTQADAQALPFDDESFDLVWTEHVQMNIADKEQFYGEAARVLRPGGRILFHDIFQGPGGEPFFPVPWADEPALSALCPPERARACLDELGLTVSEWVDGTEPSRAFFETLLERFRSQGPPPLGLHLVVKGSFETKIENLTRGLAERRVVTVFAVADKPG